MSQTDTDPIEQKAIKERLMNEGDNYFTVFPIHMIRLATESMTAPTPNLATQKKNWKNIETMAKLMQKQVWKSREEGLRDELVNSIVEKVEERIASIQDWAKENAVMLKDAATVLASVAEKVEVTREKASHQTNPAATGNEQEDGEITTQTRSYAQAVAAKEIASQLQRPRHNAVILASNSKDRRFTLRSDTELDWDKPEQALMQKANKVLDTILDKDDEAKEGDVKVVAVQKVRGNGILCVMRSVKEMEWMKEGDRLEQFSTNWGSNATARPNYHEVIAEFVPIETSVEPWSFEDIEKDSSIPHNSIARARWIKKPELRKPKQRVAHLNIAFRTRDAANEAIRKGLIMAGKMVNVRRDTKEPQRCMKCQQFGHIARECKSTADICGRCKEEHPTRLCEAEQDSFYCAVCKEAGHTAADRNCPSLLRKIKERSQREPERNYQFFVTEDPETWGNDNPSEDQNFNQSWRMDVRKGYDENWRVVKEGRGTGRLAGSKPYDEGDKGHLIGSRLTTGGSQPAGRGRTLPGRADASSNPRQQTLNFGLPSGSGHDFSNRPRDNGYGERYTEGNNGTWGSEANDGTWRQEKDNAPNGLMGTQ